MFRKDQLATCPERGGEILELKEGTQCTKSRSFAERSSKSAPKENGLGVKVTGKDLTDKEKPDGAGGKGGGKRRNRKKSPNKRRSLELKNTKLVRKCRAEKAPSAARHVRGVSGTGKDSWRARESRKWKRVAGEVAERERGAALIATPTESTVDLRDQGLKPKENSAGKGTWKG